MNNHSAQAMIGAGKPGCRNRRGIQTFRLAALLILLACQLAPVFAAQLQGELVPALTDDFVKNGPRVLAAFGSVARTARGSVAVLAVDGARAAMGTLVDTNGFLITKASELKAGKLTCILASGQEVTGEVVATDDANDVALVKTSARGLKSIEWASGETAVGQWVATPGLGPAPEAVGIISVPPRKILPKRAVIGVVLDTQDSPARLDEVTPGFGAAKAGLKAGDIILSVNGVVVTKREELVNTLREIREGKTVKLRVQRDGEEFEASVEMVAESALLNARYGRGGGGGRGFDRADRMNRMGSDVSQRAEAFELAIQHDTVLEPWQCGGPLVNLEGKAVGINIARAGRVASYALPTALVKRIVEELKAQAASNSPRK